MEIKFPYFNDVYRMHWLAQPFAVVCNLFLGLLFFAGVAFLYMIYAVLCGIVFILAIPFIIFSEIWDWVSGL